MLQPPITTALFGGRRITNDKKAEVDPLL